jgi:hypothetical protein
MSVDQFDIDSLIAKGLSYDIDEEKSDDFTIVNRYDDFMWDVNWLKHNRVFAWHVDTSIDLKLKMDRICNMTMDDIRKEINSS